LVDHKDKGDGLVDKTNDIDKDLDQRIKDLKDLIGNSKAKLGLAEKIQYLEDEIKENLKKGKEIL
jgi:hypothetical protein